MMATFFVSGIVLCSSLISREGHARSTRPFFRGVISMSSCQLLQEGVVITEVQWQTWRRGRGQELLMSNRQSGQHQPS